MMRQAFFSALLLLGLMQPVWAARLPIHEAAESPEYGRKAGGMLGRGLLNLSTCFVDLIINVVNETKNGPPLVGTLVGLGKGTGCTTLRALSGGLDVITFWVPGFNGAPVSDSYENCMMFSETGVAPSMSPSAPAVTYEAEPVPEPQHPVHRSVTLPASPSAPVPEKPRYTK